MFTGRFDDQETGPEAFRNALKDPFVALDAVFESFRRRLHF